MKIFNRKTKKIALVFAGGGGKGSYEVGVWKYLHETGMDEHICAVSGTSVGGLNAAMVSGADVCIAEEMWCKCSQDKIIEMPKPEELSDWAKKEVKIIVKKPKGLASKALTAAKSLIDRKGKKDEQDDEVLIDDSQECAGDLAESKTYKGVKEAANDGDVVTEAAVTEALKERLFFARDGLEKIIKETLKIDGTFESKIPCYITCLRCEEKKVERFLLNGKTEEEIVTYLLATTAIPHMFEKVEINGVQYEDGGFRSVGDNVPVKPVYDDPNVDAIIAVHLKKEPPIDKTLYPDKEIIDIFPSKELGNAFTGLLDFTGEGARMRIKQGYADAQENAELRRLLEEYLPGRQYKKVERKDADLEEFLNQISRMWREGRIVCPVCRNKIEYKQKSMLHTAGWKCVECGKKFDIVEILKGIEDEKPEAEQDKEN